MMSTPSADLASRDIRAVISARPNRGVKTEHDRPLYQQRNCIERMFGLLKVNRAIANRYVPLANCFGSRVHAA
jgi:transposase